jgi:hypothetical protein
VQFGRCGIWSSEWRLNGFVICEVDPGTGLVGLLLNTVKAMKRPVHLPGFQSVRCWSISSSPSSTRSAVVRAGVVVSGRRSVSVPIAQFCQVLNCRVQLLIRQHERVNDCRLVLARKLGHEAVNEVVYRAQDVLVHLPAGLRDP